MTPQQIDAMKLALGALNDLAAWNDGEVGGHMDEPYAAGTSRKAITAIKEALKEHAMRETQRLGQEIEQEPAISKWVLREVYFDEDGEPTMHRSPPRRKPLTNGEIYTAYITATNQTLRATDERLAFAFARAIEAAHGIKENT